MLHALSRRARGGAAAQEPQAAGGEAAGPLVAAACRIALAVPPSLPRSHAVHPQAPELSGVLAGAPQPRSKPHMAAAQQPAWWCGLSDTVQARLASVAGLGLVALTSWAALLIPGGWVWGGALMLCVHLQLPAMQRRGCADPALTHASCCCTALCRRQQHGRSDHQARKLPAAERGSCGGLHPAGIHQAGGPHPPRRSGAAADHESGVELNAAGGACGGSC